MSAYAGSLAKLLGDRKAVALAHGAALTEAGIPAFRAFLDTLE